MVNNPPIDLLRHPKIEAAISCLHVRDWDFAPLRGDGGER
jgi:hypothetical protein